MSISIEPLAIEGAFEVTAINRRDERGLFQPVYSATLFKQLGLSELGQVNLSRSPSPNTVRGMHYSDSGAKLVQCVDGCVCDVLLDVRKDSKTFGQHVKRNLLRSTEHANKLLYIPAGVAHGYMTLSPGVELLYVMYDGQEPHVEHGVRWNDPTFSIDWPCVYNFPLVINDRDANYPNFGE